MTLACAEVQRERGVPLFETSEREQVRLGQIGDVDVVANRRAVWRGVVRSKDLQRRSASKRGTDREWNEVRLWVVIFTQLPFRVSTGSIEVTQSRIAQGVGPLIPVESALDGELRLTVWIDRLLGVVL